MRREGARRALAVHEQAARAAVERVLLGLGVVLVWCGGPACLVLAWWFGAVCFSCARRAARGARGGRGPRGPKASTSWSANLIATLKRHNRHRNPPSNQITLHQITSPDHPPPDHQPLRCCATRRTRRACRGRQVWKRRPWRTPLLVCVLVMIVSFLLLGSPRRRRLACTSLIPPLSDLPHRLHLPHTPPLRSPAPGPRSPPGLPQILLRSHIHRLPAARGTSCCCG